jgi:hypothetical protein
MKLCNFLRLDPSYEGGLKAGSHLDEEVWNEFANDRTRLHAVAQAIRRSSESIDAEVQPAPISDEVDEAIEGQLLTRVHRMRERNRELVEKKKRKVLQETGKLSCEVCTFDFNRAYGGLGAGFIECHHTIPLSQLQPGEKTRMKDWFWSVQIVTECCIEEANGFQWRRYVCQWARQYETVDSPRPEILQPVLLNLFPRVLPHTIQPTFHLPNRNRMCCFWSLDAGV